MLRYIYITRMSEGMSCGPWPCSDRRAQSQATLSLDSRPEATLSTPSYWETVYTSRDKEIALLSHPRSWQWLLCGTEGTTEEAEQLWAHGRHSPSTLTVGKDTGTIQFGGKMPRCAMCSFLLLHRGFPKYCEAPVSAHGTLLSLSSSCSSRCQAATKD